MISHITSKSFVPLILILFAILIFPVGKASAQEANPANHVQAKLLASRDAAVPGQSFDLMIAQDIDADWHTYWKNPGDSGIPLSYEWDVPEGITFGEYIWSTPKTIRYEGVVDFGYSNNAYITTTVTVPQDFEGDTLTLTADLNWLVCQEICIPENQQVRLTLPVQAQSEPANEALFDKAASMEPVPYQGNATFTEENSTLYLKLAPTPAGFSAAQNARFIPEEWGIIRNGAFLTLSENEGVGLIEIPRDTRALEEIANYRGVLKYEANGQTIATDITFVADPAMEIASDNTIALVDGAPESPQLDAPQSAPANFTFIQAMLYALIGGLILNLMPCVFPILSMKALSFTKLSAKERKEAAKHGIFYTLGVIASMVAFSGLLIALKSAGAQIGWGFQMQNPLLVSVLFCLFFVIGLNFLGMFDVNTSLGNFTNRFSTRNGFTNDFMTGVLVVLVATPCTAPFMAAALGYALVQPSIVTLSVFVALGFGLALPFLLLALVPALQRHMPKPGHWMVVFKQLLAFPMFIACVWLAWVLTQQTGANGIAAALMAAILISFFIFVSRLKGGLILFITGVICLFGFYKSIEIIHMADIAYQDETPVHDADVLLYTPEVLEEALAGDDIVFVNMTAAWCITCKVNERTTIKDADVMAAFEENDVTYIMGDWTRFDANITQYLESFGRSGVPIYVIYKKPDANGARGEPVLLPQILTPDIVLNALENAG